MLCISSLIVDATPVQRLINQVKEKMNGSVRTIAAKRSELRQLVENKHVKIYFDREYEKMKLMLKVSETDVES